MALGAKREIKSAKKSHMSAEEPEEYFWGCDPLVILRILIIILAFTVLMYHTVAVRWLSEIVHGLTSCV